MGVCEMTVKRTRLVLLDSRLRRSCNPVTQSHAFHCHFAHSHTFSLYGFIPRSDLCLNQSWIFWNWTARMLGSVKMKTSIKGQINFLKNMFFWLSSMILSYDMLWDCFKNTYELLNASALKSPLNESHIFQCISQDVCCVWNISHAKYFTQTLKDVNSYNFEILRAHTHFWNASAHTHFWNASEVPMC